MRAFIVRPFGPRKTGGEKPIEIDFDRVERELIDPALRHFGITGRTTLEIAAQNNIRIDMFQQLIAADLVIADISIHNANVFYELGIRHALRDRHTVLLRCKGDDVPFDLKTDRYLEYSHLDPAAALPQLLETLGQTTRSRHKDSPVFQLLPELEPEDPAKFLVVPREFTEEVERARASREPGDLELLGEEAVGFAWETLGLRLVGRAQFQLKAWEGARETWQEILRIDPDDLEANTALGTVHQRLSDLTRSDQAVRRVLDRPNVPDRSRAEAHSLLGSNEKVRWREVFEAAAPEARRVEALRTPHLENARTEYDHGFEQDCNHYYSGLNALALLTVQIELADAFPEVWAETFEDDTQAALDLARRKSERETLAAAVEWSLRTAERRAERENASDLWIGLSRADLRLLTSKRPQSVAAGYRAALAAASPFDVEAVARQLRIYEQLGVLAENMAAARAVVAALPAPPVVAAAPRVLLFTGHRIDAPGRARPRFPGDREQTARTEIRRIAQEEHQLAGGNVIGVAGGASGGDILFHEVCHELGIPTALYLAIPPIQYQVSSVQDGGALWVERFRALCDRVRPRILQDAEPLSVWLEGRTDYTVWQRNNLWMLHNALALAGGANVTLIALWDGEAVGDGPGGTADMVARAVQRGAKKQHIETKALFALTTTPA
jgi:tetratricopeptide (TPR) repeat protein